MKWRARMYSFFSILLIFLLFIHFPIPYLHYNSTTILPRINYFKERSNVTFIHLHSSLLLQFSFDDHRRGNMGSRSLRIIFATKMNRPQLNCIFDDKKEVEGKWYEMSENHKKEYGIFVLSCSIPVNTHYIETFRITVPNREWMSRELRVDYVIPEKEPKEFRMEYAICSPLIFGMKYTKEKLVEFVEMNKLLGVQKISLYIDYLSVRKELIETIRFYEKQGILDAVGYHEPMKSIWYHGQLGLIMDCLVRHSTSTRYISFQDLDEFIVAPRGIKTVNLLPKLLNQSVISLRVSTQLMSISNTTYPQIVTNIGADETADDTYSKCIIRPFHVFEQGIHHTSRSIFDSNTLERADFDELKVFHFKEDYVLESEDSSIRDHYGSELREKYFMALKEMTNK